jgi:lipoprotein LprG
MKIRNLLILLLGVAFLAACRQEPAEIVPTPTPDPGAILRQAGAAMQGLSSARFEMTRSGGPVYLDPERTLTFNSVTGQYAAPDSVRAVIKTQAMGLALEVNTIAIGDDQWLTNPLTRQWEKLPPGWGFNPAVIFDPALGWRPLFEEDVTDLSPVALVELDGRSLQHIRATVAGERVHVITAGLAGGEPVTVDVWLDPATAHVVRVQFTTSNNGAEPSAWLLTFSDFNAPATIEPPQ